jgi:hypothetical protein
MEIICRWVLLIKTMTIGNKIWYLRKRKKMKQEDLSKRICSVRISKIENEILLAECERFFN